ncbi:MAG: BatA domain-containing protein [Rhodospirillales bacterium]|nr:BatA domain-containing protein [Rhodospirillales bacterium]MCB9995541.1 BatA domain-containing protein [Rhodospirillales bacterium]
MSKRPSFLKPVFKLAAAATLAAPLAFSAGAFAEEANTTPQVTQPQSSHEAVTYANPWVLLGGAALPLLLLLMKMNPPPPRSVPYSPIHILKKTKASDHAPEQVPWWLRQLRMTAAAIALVAMAQPLFNPDEPLPGEGPLLLVVDNGWASAQHWKARSDAIKSLIDRAEREDRKVVLLSTVPAGETAGVTASTPMSAAEARGIALAMEPMPWPVDHKAALAAIDSTDMQKASVIWLSNSLGTEDTGAFAARLKQLGSLTIFEDPAMTAPYLLQPPTDEGGVLEIKIKKLQAAEKPEQITLSAKGEDGRVVHTVTATFEPGQTEASAAFELPMNLRNELTHITIDGQENAGAVALLEERWRPVGLINDNAPEAARGLLSGFYYIENALEPYADLRRGPVEDIMAKDLSVMIMTDDAMLEPQERAKLDQWINEGGTVLRFAGPHLADKEDDLLPVRLRPGQRDLSGTLSGSKPVKLAPFDKSSPFYGIDLPDDVIIERQILAQPGKQSSERTWAKLEDGTPLVTAEKRGQGWLVLVHTSANTDWSNLPLSGAFVDMLRSVVAQSQGIPQGELAEKQTLAPVLTLNARGTLNAPLPGARPITGADMKDGHIGPQNPPGFYGNDTMKRAHNIAQAASDSFQPLGTLPEGTKRQNYNPQKEVNLTAPLLIGGMLLFMLDNLAGIARRRKDVKAEKAAKLEM